MEEAEKEGKVRKEFFFEDPFQIELEIRKLYKPARIAKQANCKTVGYKRVERIGKVDVFLYQAV
ncbi:MAG TPA: hypothetical protein PLU97_01525, partial [Candidatus Cryptobacteroides sp.]|nr:hypothetical protein [Candidatus Cryptobacteroides sp.]